MFTFKIFRRQNDRPTTRRPQARRPLVESLEGRQLLSGATVTAVSLHAALPKTTSPVVIDAIQGNHIGTNVSEIVGNHIG